VDCSYVSGRFEVNTEFPGLPVEYSVDNGHTWLKMPTTPLLANHNNTIGYLFVTRSEGSQYILILMPTVHEVIYWPIVCTRLLQ